MNENGILQEMKRKLRESRKREREGAEPHEVLELETKQSSAVAYWDPNNSSYWMRNADGDWQRESETHVKRYMECRLFDGIDEKAVQRRMVDNYLLEVHHRLSLHYAGPLAGYPRGIANVCGSRILVTRESNQIRGRAGDWATLRTLIEELLGEQRIYLFGWLQAALKALKNGPPFRPGQAIALCGPSGSGKSLLQNLFTEIFGGRSCKPYKFMKGKTDFNSEHLGTEHLMVEDEAASTDLRTRREIGACIKSFVANETHVMYKKNKEPIMMTPFWRVSITLNDEPENLMVLPPLDDSMKDKMILLKAFPTTCAYDANSDESRRQWRKRLSADLPAFIAFLSAWKVPVGQRDVRYGIKAYQHPDILEALADLSPELRLLTLIDLLIEWDSYRNAWEGTAAKLEEVLLSADKFGRASKLFSYNTACGCYLARLHDKRPDRVEIAKRVGGKAVWRINPPKEEPIPE